MQVNLYVYFQYLEPKPGNFVSIEDGIVMGTHKGMRVLLSLQNIDSWCVSYCILQTEL